MYKYSPYRVHGKFKTLTHNSRRAGWVSASLRRIYRCAGNDRETMKRAITKTRQGYKIIVSRPLPDRWETSFQNYCRFYVIIVISIKFRYFYTEIRKKNLFTFFTAILSSIEIFVAIGRCREKYIVSRICALVLLVLLCLYIPGALLRIWTIKERYSIIIDSFAVWRE